MTVPCFSVRELINYIKSCDCEVVSTEFWDEFDRIVFENRVTGHTYFLEYRDKDKYFFSEVVKICGLIKIKPPEEHLHAYYRHKKMDNEPCYCDNGKLFKECHGK